MARAKYGYTVRCKHPGCKETGHREFRTKQSMNDAFHRDHTEGWYCAHHIHGNGALSPDGPRAYAQEIEYTNTWHDLGRSGLRRGKFWTADSRKTDSGYIYGEGWSARSEEWPAGTVVRAFTAVQVLLPDQVCPVCLKSDQSEFFGGGDLASEVDSQYPGSATYSINKWVCQRCGVGWDTMYRSGNDINKALAQALVDLTQARQRIADLEIQLKERGSDDH